MDKYKFIKSSKNISANGSRWTIDNIRDGFEYFKELNGRYPSSIEVTNFEYLPSRKTIERSFGGLVNLRRELNLTGAIDFTRGEVRSETARVAFKRAQDYELDFFNFLTKSISEVRVHEHKIIRPGNTAADFFIYINRNDGVMIDLFYAQDMHSLAGIIRIKSLKSVKVECPIYYVLIGNNDITQVMIDNLLKNRKIPIQSNISVFTESYFKDNIKKIVKIFPISI